MWDPPSQIGTGPVSPRDGDRPRAGPHGGAKSGPLEPPIRTTNRTSSRCHECAHRFTRALENRQEGCQIPIPASEAALRSGWTLENLIPHISQNPDGVRSPARVLARRLADLPRAPTRSCPPTIAWCGQCEDERSRTITIG